MDTLCCKCGQVYTDVRFECECGSRNVEHVQPPEPPKPTGEAALAPVPCSASEAALYQEIIKEIRRLTAAFRVYENTLRQIATNGRNSTRDRRNAKAALRFVENTYKTPNESSQATPTGGEHGNQK